MRFSIFASAAVFFFATRAFAHPGVHAHGLGLSSIGAHFHIIAPAALVFGAGLMLFRRRNSR